MQATKVKTMADTIKQAFPDEAWKVFENGNLVISAKANFIQYNDRIVFRTRETRHSITIERPTIQELCDRLIAIDNSIKTVTHDEWIAEGEKLFGVDKLNWRFVCPSCGHVASVQDYMEALAPEFFVGFSCIGNYLPNSRKAYDNGDRTLCDYSGASDRNPVTVKKAVKNHFEQRKLFDFDRS